jgi:hypothetical protein
MAVEELNTWRSHGPNRSKEEIVREACEQHAIELRALLAETLPLVKGWFCDAPNPGSGDLIARIEEALNHGPRPPS